MPGSPTVIAGMLADDVDVGNIATEDVIRVTATGVLDLRAINSPDPLLYFLVAARDDVRTAVDLRGRAFGIARPGSRDHTMTNLVLQSLGMNPADVRFVSIGGDAAERERRSHWGEFWYTPQFREEHADVVERIVQLAATDPPPLKSYLPHIAARQNHQICNELYRIKAPTRVLVGENDYYAPGTGGFVKQCPYLATRIPNAKLVLVPNARHGIFWERAHEVNVIIHEWLESA
jgi:pimeloyl-ACP methyl ester carboxylesterase